MPRSVRPDAVAASMGRVSAAARNAFEVLRFGGLDTGEEPTGHEIVAEERVYKLRRYGACVGGPPVVLVPPMMLSADVYDVSPDNSAVASLAGAGLDPYVVDFGAPEHEPGGLERTLTDHVLGISHAVDVVRELTDRDVHLAGYSQGGMFCYQAASYRRGAGIKSVITFGAEVDTSGKIPPGIPEDVVIGMLDFMSDNVLTRFALPAWMSRMGFRMLDPVKTVRQQLEFVFQLHDRDALVPRESQRRFLMREGWVAWPGPAIAELVKQFVATNRMLSGGFVLDGVTVSLADLDVPLLSFVGTKDDIAPPPGVRAVAQAAPRAQIYESEMETGHFGLVVGSKAVSHTWPTVIDWVGWLEDDGPLPGGTERIEVAEPVSSRSQPSTLDALGNLAVGIGRTVVGSSRRQMAEMRQLAVEAADQYPRLARLGQVRPTTRISAALVQDEQAGADPDATNFLYLDRAFSNTAAKERIDNIVTGLLSVGVRQGEHIGVLMDIRPTSLALVVALNRIGAVGVLLRPDGPTRREIELGAVTRVIADPELADVAVDAAGVPVLVLGGGADRPVPAGTVDMEAIDVAGAETPAWFSPNPGLARDLAYVLFTGAGDTIRVNRITNGRWALSAFGAASAAALTRADTVYCISPISHPSGLLTSTGAAIAGGARIALASRHERGTFWDEVRRYGVTVVPYTWTQLRELVHAERHPGEKHHPVRLFMGSGMAPGLWRRVIDRLRPARVLEFYASPDGDVVLANVSGEKVGAMGRPLPGSAEVCVARWDVEAGALVEGDDGYAVRCGAGETGVLLARVGVRGAAVPDTAVRSVFSRSDAWISTGDLFQVDEDGDHWLVGPLASVVHTNDGPVPHLPAQRALSEVPGVDLAVTYGVRIDDEGTEALVGAVSLHAGAELDRAGVQAAMEAIDPACRPTAMRVVDTIDRTTWFRVRASKLQAEGVTPDAFDPMGA